MWLCFAEDNTPSDSPSADVPSGRPDEPATDSATPDAYDEAPALDSVANPTVMLLLPWLISGTLHAGVVLLALFVVWAGKPPEAEEIIIPIARWSERPGGALVTQEQIDLTQANDARQVATQVTSDSQSIQQLNTEVQSKLSLVGVAGGGASSGKLSPFVSSGGGAPKANFYGAGGNATKIIYIVDASGSLIDTLPFVIKELKRSINELIEKQRFTVIFFQKDQAIEVSPPRLKRATTANKKRIADWISEGEGNIVPQGSSNPMKALRLAFDYRPDLIFLLSDDITGAGRYEIDRDVLLDVLDKLNPTRRTKINTIQFVYPDDLSTLDLIAEEHGGIARFVSRDDLGIGE